MKTNCPRWIASLAMTMCPLLSTVASAQAPASDRAPSISVEARELAADAYDQGTTAYLARDYASAAHWFERAYRLVPTSTALLQAVRAASRADVPLRAANLGLELRDDYPGDHRANEIAHQAIEAVRATSALVEVHCDRPCTLELDGSLLRHPALFVTPDVEHELKAGFQSGETSSTVSAAAGQTLVLELNAPLPPPPPPIPRWTFLTSLGVTTALGAVTIWSGLDAKSGVSAYESAARTASSPGINEGASPTPAQQAQSLLDDGRHKERRTNVLIGVTAAMAATTVVIGVFTNWRNESREAEPRRIEATVGAARAGGAFTLRGHF